MSLKVISNVVRSLRQRKHYWSLIISRGPNQYCPLPGTVTDYASSNSIATSALKYLLIIILKTQNIIYRIKKTKLTLQHIHWGKLGNLNPNYRPTATPNRNVPPKQLLWCLKFKEKLKITGMNSRGEGFNYIATRE